MSRSRDRSVLATVLTQLSEYVGPNQAVAPMIIPPDGGWGWVIVFVGIWSSCLVDGVTYCYYLFREPMSKELNIHQADISYLASLNTGFYFVGAVFACSFGNQWGFRATLFIGGVVTSLSYASGYFFHDIMYFYAIIGFFGGLGSGFISVGGGLPTNFYFDKKRSIAVGIISCGSGLGGILMPSIVGQFMSRYGWRSTFLFEGGLLSLTILMAILIRPLRPVMVVINMDSTSATILTRGRDESLLDYSAFRVPPLLPQDPMISHFSMRKSVLAGETGQPTIAQIVTDDTSVINIRVKENSDPTIVSRLQRLTQLRSNTMLQPSASAIFLNNVSITEEPFLRVRHPWYKCGCCRSKYISLPERPLMRTDLYYTGNLRRLPEYNQVDMDLEYHLQVTKVPTFQQTVQDLTRNYTRWCCANICNGLLYLVDYTVFKSLAFNCLAFCGFCVYVAFYLPFMFCQEQLETLGEGKRASTMLAFIGFGSMIGRGLSGLIIRACPMFHPRLVIIVMNALAAISITAFVLDDNLYFKTVCFFVFGFTVGFYLPLRSLIIVDYFGLEKLTSATGVLIICIGAGSFLGPPLAEYCKSATHNKNAPFFLCGISLFFASISLLPMQCLRNWEVKRAERKRIVGRHQQQNLYRAR